MAVTIDGTGVVSVDGTSTTQGRVRLAEDTDNGTNYVELTAPASLGANRTVTFPDSDVNFATGLGVAQGGTGATTLTANNVVLGNGTSAVQFVAPGTNGNVLTSNGTTWASNTPPASGSWVYLSTVTASNSTTVDVETTINSTYDMYVISAVDVINATSNTTLNIRLKVSGAYSSGNIYYYHNMNPAANTVANTYNSAVAELTSSIQIGKTLAAAAPGSFSFTCYLFSPSNTSLNKSLLINGVAFGSNTTTFLFNTAGTIASTAAVTGVRFLSSSGNITSGTFRLYGIKNS